MKRAEARIRLLSHIQYRAVGGLAQFLSNQPTDFIPHLLPVLGCAIAAVAADHRSAIYEIIAQQLSESVEKVKSLIPSPTDACPLDPLGGLIASASSLVATERPTTNGPLTCFPQFLSKQTLDSIASRLREKGNLPEMQLKKDTWTFTKNRGHARGVTPLTFEEGLLEPVIEELNTHLSKSEEMKQFMKTRVDRVDVSIGQRPTPENGGTKLAGRTTKYHKDAGTLLQIVQPFDAKGTKVIDNGSHFQCDAGSATLFDGETYLHKAPQDGGMIARITFRLKTPTVISYLIDKKFREPPSEEVKKHVAGIERELLRKGREEAENQGYYWFAEHYARKYVKEHMESFDDDDARAAVEGELHETLRREQNRKLVELLTK